ncbi:ABC transporter C family MRP4 [Vitis vinifera]|uniref:ABC transporter C family MRP4 n=1 Tax=Vitis vinifera TaxID=29760 RepID=A0A438I2M2_VITVI|nr:ABC transporter C family MRP4 [Vitis vinifera]
MENSCKQCCFGGSDYGIVWCCFIYIYQSKGQSPPTGSEPPDALCVEHKAFLIITFKGCIHVLSSYLNRSRDCRHGGVLQIFALGSSDGFLSGSYQCGILLAAFDQCWNLEQTHILVAQSTLRKGRVQKLQLHHIPPVPQSEKAETASSLLEETLTKQKTSVTKALFCSVWRSLAINAVFAGANTIASYMGPFLITHFVNFLSGKGDDSSYYYGLVLALIFFMAKTLESLSQRQWYLGGQRIGIRVRAALMVLVYKKSLSIKYAGSNSGKIINLINVDVDRIGDFCLCIHGVWLLPVQVGLALVILYRNLGAAPSMTALFATVLVMVGNTPLAKRQEKLHSRSWKQKTRESKLLQRL